MWEGRKEQTGHYFTLYLPQYKHPEEPTCKGTRWSQAMLILEQAEEHWSFHQAKRTSVHVSMCAGRLKQDDVYAAGTTSKMNYIHSYLLGTMEAENHLNLYYHNNFHTSHPAKWSVGM